MHNNSSVNWRNQLYFNRWTLFYLQEVELAVQGVLKIEACKGDVQDLRRFRGQYPGAA